jgi:hypothetical protein
VIRTDIIECLINLNLYLYIQHIMPTHRYSQVTVSIPTATLKGSLSRTGDTSGFTEFELFVHISNILNRLDRATIIRPRHIDRNTLEQFKNIFLENVPEVAYQTDEEIENVKDERNADIFDSA